MELTGDVGSLTTDSIKHNRRSVRQTGRVRQTCQHVKCNLQHNSTIPNDVSYITSPWVWSLHQTKGSAPLHIELYFYSQLGLALKYLKQIDIKRNDSAKIKPSPRCFPRNYFTLDKAPCQRDQNHLAHIWFETITPPFRKVCRLRDMCLNHYTHNPPLQRGFLTATLRAKGRLVETRSQCRTSGF